MKREFGKSIRMVALRFPGRGGVTAFCIALLLAAGCAGLPTRAPKVSLADLRVESVRMFETTFGVELRVINTGETPIRIQGLDCDLSLNGKHFGTGVSGSDVSVPAFESRIVPVTVYSSVFDMVAWIMEMAGKAKGNPQDMEIAYKVEGRLKLASNAPGLGSFGFSSEGGLSLSSLTAGTPLEDLHFAPSSPVFEEMPRTR